ncbi:MAG TPA: amino acid adenylation domain-containing protein, partial [Candidatus Dormibacteraeota bacterium]|nr:amino acid adenylation domain-containing protein [Candidatus Dormibacteraeota bacterium]
MDEAAEPADGRRADLLRRLRALAGRDVPISFAQRRLWFLEQLHPGRAVYNLPMGWRLRGDLDLAALRAALDGVVARHDALRARFPSEDGRPRQVVDPPGPAALDVVVAQGEAELERLAAAEAARPFDIARDPPLRARVVRLGQRDHTLLLTVHHIAADGWSLGVLAGELSELYAAHAAGRQPALPAPPIQYADYAAWQRERLQGEALARELGHWRERLRDLAPLALPTDRPRPAALRYRGAVRWFELDAELSAAARALGRAHGATLFMTLLAGFQAVLQRWAGQDDVAVGTPVAGRERAELEGLVGFFVNTLVLRGDLSGDPTFAELLARVREAALDAYAHQELPFEKLVDELHPARDLGHSPLVQVLFAVQRPAAGGLALGGVEAEPLWAHSGTTKFDISLSFWDAPVLRGMVEYDRDLFDEATIDRLAGHLRRLLAAAAADPGRRLSELPLLSDAEAAQLAALAVGPPAAPPATLQGLVAAAARRDPEALAVVCAGESLTYGELDARAERLAAALRGLGAGPEAVVGVCLERSLDLVVALLAVLKAGAAYLPLDPAYPDERLRLLLGDVGATLVVTRAPLLGRLGPGVAALCLDRPLPSGPAALGDAGPDGLCYVIHTSGSTGRPRGVAVSHASAANLALAQGAAWAVGPGDRVLQFASPGFDASVSEVFVTLAAGATLVVPAGEAPLGDDLLDLLEAERVSLVTLPPSLLAVLPVRELPDLRTLVCAGERCTAEVVRRWSRRGRAVVNAYGPTEATVCVTMHPCHATGAAAPPIGRPIAGVRVHVLDRWLRPQPVGVPGELWVAGAGLARGYAGQPGATAERFLPDPFATGPGERLYRTGDLARWRPDGTLEHLGRVDDQAKVRGFRVEPGEVEAALRRHPGVRDCAVAVRGEQRLVAYVVAAAEWPGADALRRHLAALLPEHLVPAAYVELPTLPTTPAGKVDRRGLPEPGAPEARPAYVAPRTDAERVLAGIWARALGAERIGVHDNFFELGGDSIMGILVVTRARRAGLSLRPRQLFQHQTVAELAAAAVPLAAAPAPERPAEGDVPLTPMQRWFLDRELAGAHHWNQAMLLEAPERVDADRLRRALERLAQRHDALRLRVERRDAGWRQWIAGTAEVPLDVVEGAVSEARAAEAQAGLDPGAGPLARAAGPLARAVLFRGDDADRLLLVVHHLGVDWVSWRPLLEDLDALYAGVAPAPATSSYQRWAQAVERRAAGCDELDWWLGALGGPVAPLPVDLREGEDDVASEAAVEVALSEAETAALVGDALRAHRAQAPEALLAALGAALCPWAGGRVLVDVEGHGREELEPGLDVSQTVGWFTTMYPVHLAPAEAAVDHLRAVKERLRAVPAAGRGYGLLRHVRGEAALRALPAAEVGFNYLGRTDPVLGGAGWRPVAGPTGPVMSPRGRRAHPLELTAVVADGRLRVRWAYSRGRHRAETIARLAGRFRDALLELLAPGQRAVGPSDFPLAGLDGRELDALLAERPDLEDVYPLSPLQQGLLFHSLADPAVYVQQHCFALRGELDAGALREAWRGLVERHDVLRGEVRVAGEREPLLLVGAAPVVPWREEDWRALPEAEREARLREWQRTDLERGFPLEGGGPLLRLALLRVGEREHWLAWSHHHLLVDGWSVGRLLRELFERYAALARGEELRLGPARPYRDYVAWLRERGLGEAEAYWRRALGDRSEPSRLGLARADLPSRDLHVELSEGETEALRGLARERRVTLNTVALGAWAVVLSRHGSGREVVFGTTVSGRSGELEGLEEMVGLFINTLP